MPLRKPKTPPLEGAKVFTATPAKSRRKLLTGLAAFIVILALIIVVGLLVGRWLSHRDDNDDPAAKSQSEQRITQSPQSGQTPAAPEPSDSAGSNQLNQ
ncbi:MAG: hypothetical protein JWM37_192 [Candidatus Saccharibacteria bacterium]|nr:hypothetical protein [Candidatus Saccharibacteria bacterium]